MVGLRDILPLGEDDPRRLEEAIERCRRERGVEYCTRCPLVRESLLDCALWRRWVRARRVHHLAGRARRTGL